MTGSLIRGEYRIRTGDLPESFRDALNQINIIKLKPKKRLP